MRATYFTCEQVARAALGEPAKREGTELLYPCIRPERHKNGDAHPSLKVNPRKDFWGCFVCNVKGKGGWSLAAFLAGCDPGDKPAVKAWLRKRGLLTGKSPKARHGADYKVVETYNYHDVQGRPLLRKHRLEAEGKEKTFRWEHLEGGKWVNERGGLQPALYRSDEIQDAISVQIHEGERKANKAFELGFLATCTPDGAKSWRHEHASTFTRKHVSIFPDNDDAGRTYAHIIAADIFGCAVSVKIIYLPGLKEKGDIVDWLASGGTREQLERIIAETPEWRPASGAELIRRFEEIFKDKIIALKGVPLVAALYAFMTHCYKIFSWIPYLSFFSPLESCGKSHAADIVGWASARPEILVSITEASLFRLITVLEPTVVIDEAEVLCGDGETAVALRAVLHAGNSPDDAIIRCAPNTYEVERFSPWCPKIFCAIGKLPRTLASRCIAVGMKRKKASERTGKFIRHKVKNELVKLSGEIAAWVAQHEKEIHRVYDSLPDDSFEDRDRENFAPLEAILTVAGRARLSELTSIRASLTRASQATLTDDSPGARVLEDMRRVLVEKQVSEMASAELCAALVQMENSPWPEYKGKPLTPAWLAALLRPFGIVPDRVGGKDSRARGYTLHQLEDAFSRYLQPPPASQTVHPSINRINNGENEDFRPSTESAVDTLKNAVSPAKNADGGRVDTLKPGIGGEEYEPRIFFVDDREVV